MPVQRDASTSDRTKSQDAADGDMDVIANYLGDRNAKLDKSTLLSILCIARVQRISAALRANQDEVAQRFGLYAGDIYTLYLLERSADHAARPGDLATALTMTTGGMTKRLDRLEKHGFVVRKRDPGDRRGVLVRLTTEGEATAQEARRSAQRRPAGTSGNFTEAELSQLSQLLQRLEAAVIEGRSK